MTNIPRGPADLPTANIDGHKIVKDAVRQPEDNDTRLDQLELTVKNLSIINEALYGLLTTKLNVEDAELTVAMAQVVINRKNRLERKLTCSSCSMQVPAVRQKCMYCGGELIGEVAVSPFDI